MSVCPSTHPSKIFIPTTVCPSIRPSIYLYSHSSFCLSFYNMRNSSSSTLSSYWCFFDHFRGFVCVCSKYAVHMYDVTPCFQYVFPCIAVAVVLVAWCLLYVVILLVVIIIHWPNNQPTNQETIHSVSQPASQPTIRTPSTSFYSLHIHTRTTRKIPARFGPLSFIECQCKFQNNSAFVCCCCCCYLFILCLFCPSVCPLYVHLFNFSHHPLTIL